MKKEIRRCFDGPSFLWDRVQCWEKDIRSNTLSGQDSELMKVIKVIVTQIENVLLSKLQENTSNRTKQKRLILIVMGIIKQCTP